MGTLYVLGVLLTFSFNCECVLGIVNGKSSLNVTSIKTGQGVNRGVESPLEDESIKKFRKGFIIDRHVLGAEDEHINLEANSSKLSLHGSIGFGNFGIGNIIGGIGGKSGCGNLQPAPNSAVVCTNGKCQGTCKAGYYTSTGETVTSYICKNSQWVNEKTGRAVVDNCEPKCEPACKNGGLCISPKTCKCPRGFSGPACETEKVSCPSQSPTPLFSRKICTSENCTATCVAGYAFADGSKSLELFCRNGKWVSSKTRENSTKLPDCLPPGGEDRAPPSAVCDPLCLNGGKCVANNFCFCPEEYRGNLCQYHYSVCDASKLNFNGNYNCSGDDEQFSCQLSCPQNTDPVEGFQPKYTCLYSEGKFKPTTIPQCRIGQVIDGVKFSEYESTLKIISPGPTTCVMSSAGHLKTLNNHVLNFKGNCLYTLIQDEKEHLFHIQVDIKEYTVQKIIIYINNMKYVLSKTADGKPSLTSEGSAKSLSIPCQLSDLKVEIASGKSVAVYLPATNLYLVWNLQDEIQLDVSTEFWDRTSGLCGRGSIPFKDPVDLQKFIGSAVVSSLLLEKCEQPVEESAQCEGNDVATAKQLCSRLETDFTFQPCRQKIPVQEYINSCEWSYCNCKKSNRLECICQIFAKFVQHYNQLADSVKIDWRDQYNCSFGCPLDQIYTSCMPVSQGTCTADEVLPSTLQRYCEEGCICAAGTVLHEDRCINKEDCACMYNGQFHEPGSVVPKDCNKCTCIGGKWSCTEAVCKAECFVIGDGHYKTFDGKRYDFSGSCSYKLLVTDNVTIEMDQSASITRINSKFPRSLKSVIIHTGRRKITLKEFLKVTVDNEEVENLPTLVDEKTYIRKASTFLLQVALPSGLDIYWDGKNRLQIFTNASLLGKTKGLCGTFNNNQQDDLLTPEGDVEKSTTAFVSKWKTDEKCENSKTFDRSEACEIFIQNKPIAESYCKNITSDIFKDCQSTLNPSEYYDACLIDICACQEDNVAECFCPSVDAYAGECARRGVVIDWRNTIRSCDAPCPSGQKFDSCGPSCQRSCSDIAHGEICHSSCAEGCYCPAGFTFNEQETCIPISECPCRHKGQKHPAGYVDVRNETGSMKACECKNAVWECREATELELEKYKRSISCSSNMEYVECEPPEPITCKNMHNPPRFSARKCMAGCVCKEGYVLNSVSKKCVKPTECPCHHGGRSYSEGEVMRQDCNNCTCFRGRWECTEIDCPTTCSSWGDSHFRTFDGRFFDFQGTCDYVLAKGKLSDSETFSVSIEIVPCGTGGTSCTKSVTINVGSENKTESVTLHKDNIAYLKKSFKKFDVISTGLYVTVMLKGMAVSLIWDKGTRVSLQVHPRWKNKLSGLCGNNNGNALDDFQTPSGGLVEVSPSVFADSWKLQQHCPFPSQIEDPCVIHPYRKFWSVMKCSHLKDDPLFKQCHSHVPVEDYYKRCVFDSCACDQGGDCECLCTVFSAYAQECTAKGVAMKWRRQDICPMQCEPGTVYSPCISSCPVPTCNNLGMIDSVLEQCAQLPCVEGCEKKKCPTGQVLRNSSSHECILPTNCECMNIDGQVFQENEKIYEDECHSCYCSKGKKVCTGVPCTIITLPPLPSITSTTTQVPPISGPTPPPSKNCTNGWSEWIRYAQGTRIAFTENQNIQMANFQCPNGPKSLRCQVKTRGLIFLSDWEDVACIVGLPIVCSGRCVELRVRIECDCNKLPQGPNITVPIIPPPTKCKVQCNQLCHYYQHQLHEQNKCVGSQTCLDTQSDIICPAGYFWRDEETCVTKDACTCSAHDGSVIKPTTFKEEEDCSTCQCINNEYVCTPSMCPPTEELDTVTEPYVTEPTVFTVPPVSVSPLPPCDAGNLISIDEEASYNASSSSEDNPPGLARLITSAGRIAKSFFARASTDKYIENTNSWRAAVSNRDQYLEIDLGRIQPIYGVVTAGSPVLDEYVKTFKVLYSSDGVLYSYATSASGNRNLFRGTFHHRTPETQLFSSAVEARFLRIKPVAWQKWISMLVRVLGCSLITETPPSKVCGEPMGLADGKMNPNQVTVSSKLKNFTPKDASLSSSSGWAPFLASSDQWIQFDFLAERIIDGIKTKGSTTIAQTDSWIEAYKIKYSSDGVNWNPVIDSTKAEQIFSGNYDGSHSHTNVFNPPIRARYLRLYPVKWTQFPSLRVEVLGCYEPYPGLTTTTTEPNASNETTPYPDYQSTTESYLCNVCSGILLSNCSCADGTFWNGDSCVKEEMCPCVDGLLTYPVGSVFIKTGCEKCVCSLGGSVTCQPTAEDCPQCGEQHKLRVVNDDCSCECKPCPANTRLCPTSNICLDESLWCNGYKECPDDETDDCEDTATGKPPPPQGNTTTTTKRIVCPVPTCPEGYTVVYSQLTTKSKPRGITALLAKAKDFIKKLSINETIKLASNTGEIFSVQFWTSSTQSAVSSKNVTEYIKLQNNQSTIVENVPCKDWTCVAKAGGDCSKPRCPAGTRLTTKWTGETCPMYECLVPPSTEKECSINGRLITTFDGLAYKYDLCDHVLAQDRVFNTWKVRKVIRCPLVGPCVASLIIRHRADLIELYSNFTARFNGYMYNIPQLQAIGSQSKRFVIQPVSSTYVIFGSIDLKFNVVWGSTGAVKVIIDSSLFGIVNGLCGIFDFNKENDRSKPDGTVTANTQEFGDSWKVGKEPCEGRMCSKDVQEKAKDICDSFKLDPFGICDFTMNINDQIAKCYESVCTCASTTSDFDKDCRCTVLNNFALKCLNLQPGVDLSSWRLKFDCPANCTSPFVYHECYDRQCEPSCESPLERCPHMQNRCFPGCYCPEGLVRKGNTCIKPAECRDCVCSSNGYSQLTTFDQLVVPLGSTCASTILTKTKTTEALDAELKIILTSAPCVNPYLKGICAHGLTIIIDNKEILMAQSESNLNALIIKVDNTTVEKFPYEDGFMKIVESPGLSAKLSVPSLQLDVTFMSRNKGFMVQLPSHVYSDKLRGVCGTCNKDQTDDLIIPSGESAETYLDFVNSWKSNYTADTDTRNCSSAEKTVTVITTYNVTCAAPKVNDPCLLLQDKKTFGKCHAIVDPRKFVNLCHNFTCHGVSHCSALEAYAVECQKHEICTRWRNANTCPYTCPQGFVYDACSIGCEINCDNYKLIRENPALCVEPVSERCVCPPGKVISNGVCIDELRCQPCDKSNHYYGDRWSPDNCTTCECLKDGSVSCRKTECAAETVCPVGMKAEIDLNNDDPCCLKHVCVIEESKVNCSDPIKIECGKDQIVKLDVTPENCTHYVCVCVPREECPAMNLTDSVELLPGIVQREKKEGCCPSVELVCDKNLCTIPTECPQYHILKEVTPSESCCPVFKCVLPPKTCLHEYHWIAADNGSERIRLPSEVSVELKQVGDTWSDGPCRLCICTNETTKGICNPIKCGEPEESEDYVLKPFYHYGECCPEFKSVACKKNGVVHEVNSSWAVENEPCKTMQCIQNPSTGDVSMREIVQTCPTDCEKGWRYTEPENKSAQCCGSCKQEACVDVAGVLHSPNTTWFSDDQCIKSTCDDQFLIMSFMETCPDVSSCPPELIYRDKCCQKCRILPVDQTNCLVVSMPLNDTVKLISKHDAVHGDCLNLESIEGFSRCDGSCISSPFFNEYSLRYGSTCSCCVGSHFESKEIQLVCSDGYTINQTVQIPSACHCQSCGGVGVSLEPSTVKKPMIA